MILLGREPTHGAHDPGVFGNAELGAHAATCLVARCEALHVDAVRDDVEHGGIALLIAPGERGQRRRHGDVRVHQRRGDTTQPAAASDVGIRAMFGVHHGRAREARCGRPVNERVRIVRVHDVDAFVAQEPGEANRKRGIDAVALGDGFGPDSGAAKFRGEGPFRRPGEGHGQHEVSRAPLLGSEVERDLLLTSESERRENVCNDHRITFQVREASRVASS